MEKTNRLLSNIEKEIEYLKEREEALFTKNGMEYKVTIAVRQSLERIMYG